MAQLLISFETQNVRVDGGEWLFGRRQPLRFEWLALLALKRRTLSGDYAWVSIEEVGKLPSWRGKPKDDIGTYIGRYLESLRGVDGFTINTRSRWRGPYRLDAPALSVEFDVPIPEVKKRLRLVSRSDTSPKRDELLRFTPSFIRAVWLVFQGRLKPPRKNADSAYQRFMSLTDDSSYSPTLRLLACLAGADVQHRLGQFRGARTTLQDYASLLRQTPDLSLKAQYYLKLAWAHQRSSTGTQSNRAVEACLNKAQLFAEQSGDRAALGLLAERRGGYLTKKQHHLEAVNSYVTALQDHLIAGKYDRVEATCGNIGSVLHRLGPSYYGEARQWLLLSIGLVRLLSLGRDDAHAEMILAKIYIEQEKQPRRKSELLLKRAERIASRVGNQVNLGDIKMVWGFWHQRFGTRAAETKTLVDALRTFMAMSEFDTEQKMKYIRSKFPEVWPQVAQALKLPHEPNGQRDVDGLRKSGKPV